MLLHREIKGKPALVYWALACLVRARPGQEPEPGTKASKAWLSSATQGIVAIDRLS